MTKKEFYNIRRERQKLGLFQKDVAKALGVSQPNVSYWEKMADKGLIKPYIVTAVRAWLESHK